MAVPASKRIIKNTIYLYLRVVITSFIVLYSTRIVLSSLGQDDYGIYTIVFGSVSMLGVLNISMSQSTQRFINYASGQNDIEKLVVIFNNSVVLHLVIGLAIAFLMAVLFFPLFNGILNIPQERVLAAKTIYWFFVACTFFSMITVPYESLINAHEDFAYYTVVGIIESLLKLGAACYLLVCEQDKLIVYGLLMAVIMVFMMVLMRLFCVRKYEECVFHPFLYCRKQTLEELGRFSGWNFIGAFSNMLGNHGCNILLNHYFGTIVIAAKNIADQVSGQLAVLTRNLTKAINPAITKAEGSGDREVMITYTLKACRFGFILYLILAIPFLFENQAIVELWLKNVPDWTILFCQLQIIRTLLEQIYVPLNVALMAQGEIRFMNIADLVLNVLCFFIVFLCYSLGCPPYWHYIVSITMIVIIPAFIRLRLVHAHCGMDYRVFFKEVGSSIASCTLLCVLVSFFFYEVLRSCCPLPIRLCVYVLLTMLIIAFWGIKHNERLFVIVSVKSFIQAKWKNR